ncbi:hypothetical protein HMPREF1139_0105 [Campylobacter sp. FOBRC14]|nr:hypothetical protein HMPREF1139_0105 [Campylobacter sp. FOBRC14]
MLARILCLIYSAVKFIDVLDLVMMRVGSKQAKFPLHWHYKI